MFNGALRYAGKNKYRVSELLLVVLVLRDKRAESTRIDCKQGSVYKLLALNR